MDFKKKLYFYALKCGKTINMIRKIIFALLISTSSVIWAQQHNSYVVKENDTLESIAKIFRVSPNDIKNLNPALETGLKKGMMLVIPNSKVVYYSTKQPSGFKYHTAKEKETLYGIAQAYQISQDDLRRYNIVLYSKELQIGQELTIPVYNGQNEPTGVTKGKEGLTKYVVKPKEGKWRIAQNHGISQEELEKLNPNLPEVLKEGMEIWVPSGKSNLLQSTTTSERTMVLYQVEKGEGFMSLERKFNLSEKELIALNPELKDGIKLEAQIWIPKDNFMEYSATLGGLTHSAVRDSNEYLRTNMRPTQVKNISFVLPFKLGNISSGSISDMKNKLQKDKITGITTDFYSGALMAIDSLQKLGFSLNVNVYDSQGTVQGVNALASSESLKQSQVIIGPFLAPEFNKLSEIIQSSNVALLAPITNRNIELRPNVFQTVPTIENQQQKMIQFINQKYPDANIVLLADGKNKDLNEKLASSFSDAKVVDNINAIRNAFVKERTNIVFVSSDDVVFLSDVIRILYNTSGIGQKTPTFNVIMATLSKGEAYDHDSISNTQLSALKFTYPSINKYAGETNAFIRKYYDTYKISPSRYAFRGFDLTMDAVLRASISGDFIGATSSISETSYQENKFRYIKNSFKGGGYENQGVYIVRYDDLEVKEIY